MSEPDSRHFTSGRLRLHYLVWGDEKKPALLLLHGGRDHARMWDFVAQDLTDHFCVYALDLRGHGDSEWAKGSGYRLSDHVLDLTNFVETVGQVPATIMGHSLGGRIVLDFSGTYPEKADRIISIEGFGRLRPENAPADQLRRYVDETRQLDKREPRPYETLAEAEERMQEANKRLKPEMVHHLTKHAVRQQDDGSYVWKFDNRTYVPNVPEWSNRDIKKIWSGIKAKVLLVGGSDSWGSNKGWFSGDSWAGSDRKEFVTSSVKGAKVEMIDGAGHWVQHDQFERFMEVVRAFLID